MDRSCGARLQPSIDNHLDSGERKLGSSQLIGPTTAGAFEGALLLDQVFGRHTAGERQRWMGTYRRDGFICDSRLHTDGRGIPVPLPTCFARVTLAAH